MSPSVQSTVALALNFGNAWSGLPRSVPLRSMMIAPFDAVRMYLVSQVALADSPKMPIGVFGVR